MKIQAFCTIHLNSIIYVKSDNPVKIMLSFVKNLLDVGTVIPLNPVSLCLLHEKSFFSATETGFFSPTSEY
jgi:hypothetical protein